MTRVLLFLALASLTVSPVFAIGELKKEWGNKYAPKDSEFYNVARKAGCYVCHVKGVKDKKSAESRNEYGKAMTAFLKDQSMDIDSLKKEYKEGDKEAAIKTMIKMFEKVNTAKSKDGTTFGEKIKAGKLPATDAGL